MHYSKQPFRVTGSLHSGDLAVAYVLTKLIGNLLTLLCTMIYLAHVLYYIHVHQEIIYTFILPTCRGLYRCSRHAV